MTRVRQLPENDKTNGWSLLLPPRTPKPYLAGHTVADWVVVGGGYAGLAAARRLAENRPNDRIVVVEAHECGENASGRNSGFGIDVPHTTSASLDELEGSQRYMRLSRTALDWLEEIVQIHGIACDWARRGKYHAAVSARGAEDALVPFKRELSALGEPHRWLDGKEVEEELGSPYYHAAIYTPGCVLMNPAALTRGLADTLPESATLCENTPVLEFERAGDGVRLTTPKGTVKAPKMILAVNGWSPNFGFYRNRLLPFYAHASLTRPLTAAEQAALGASAGDWGLTPVNAFVSVTMRYTRDRRILIRQDINYCPQLVMSEARQQAARAVHQRMFHERFPMLSEVTLEHTWTGFVCLSQNYAPAFGRQADGIWSAVCCNAVGVTKSTISGLLTADLATGRDNPLIADMVGLGAPRALPPEPFLGLGVRARIAWDYWRARHEA